MAFATKRGHVELVFEGVKFPLGFIDLNIVAKDRRI